MLSAVLNKGTLLFEILIDAVLVVLAFSIPNMEYWSMFFKLVTSASVSILAVARLYFFIKNKGKNESKPKNSN